MMMRTFKDLHLIAKLLLLSICLLAFILLALSLFVYNFSKNEIQDIIGKRQLDNSRQIIRQIDYLLYERYIGIQEIADKMIFEDFLLNRRDHEEVKAEIEERLALTGWWDVLQLVGLDGKIKASIDSKFLGQNLMDVSPQEAEAFNFASAGQVYYSDVVFSALTGKPNMLFAAPVRDSSKAGRPVIGVVVGEFAWRVVLDILKTSSRQSTIDLYNDQGLLIGTNAFIALESVLSRPVAQSEAQKLVKLAQQTGSGIMEAKSALTQTPVLLSFVAEEGYFNYKGHHWILVSEVPAMAAFAPARRVALSLVLIVCFSFGLELTALSCFLYAIYIRPINNLARTAKAISEGDFDQRAKVESEDEIGQLGKFFNTMAVSLINRNQELAGLNAELDNLVKIRTYELESKIGELEKQREATLNILDDFKQTQLALQKADQIKSEFVSTVSHELRTPLSIIKEGVSQILDKLYGGMNQEQEKMLSIISNNIDRLARLIDDVLNFSRIEAGRIDLHIKKTDLCQLIARVIEQLAIKAQQNQIQIERCGGEIETYWSWADPDRVEQVLINLVSNSLKFTPRAGKIIIGIKEEGEFYKLWVEDTGPGITPEDFPKLFTKFTQLGRAPGPGAKGTGLGLVISKGLIGLMGGKIWAESELGKGSKFFFTVPKFKEGAK